MTDFEVTQTENGLKVRSGYLTGMAYFDDGVLYWEAGRDHGNRPIDQTRIDADSKAALRYAEVCIKNSIEKTLKSL